MSVHGDEVIVVVRDAGVGMSPDFLAKVFEPFVQADETVDRSDGGMGVGLTLVRSIIELHGGTVVASSGGKTRAVSLPFICLGRVKSRNRTHTRINMTRVVNLWTHCEF